MTDITEIINNYSDCLKELWNNNFVNPKIDFKHEIDKPFSLIQEGLFNSLVVAKCFDFSIEPNKENYYEKIQVKTNRELALFAQVNEDVYNWKKINLTGENTFHFVELFDWETANGMDCEFVKVKLTNSTKHKDQTNSYFLLKTKESKFYLV
tara:strand:- start:6 stop:461 length:456 start_codon:yes stop_codon:yes gene_type:complete